MVRVSSGSAVDRAAADAVHVLGDMWRHLDVPARLDEALGVVRLVRSHLAALPGALHAQRAGLRQQDAAAHGLGRHRHGVRTGDTRRGEEAVAQRGRPVPREATQAGSLHGRGGERRARLHDLPQGPLEPDLQHQPAGEAERRDQAQDQCRGHLPQRRSHHASGRRHDAQAERRVVLEPPIHAA